jgi:hypothetical protein
VAAAAAAGGGALGTGVVVPDVRAAVDRLRATGRPAEFLTVTPARGAGTRVLPDGLAHRRAAAAAG